MSGRVSVDADALAALIEYADTQRVQNDDEFCASRSEYVASEARFTALVTALAKTEAAS